jgi:predicted transcriptional regulator
MMSALERELVERLSALGLEQQNQVLEYARALSEAPVRGVPGAALKRFVGTISAEDAREMKEAVEGGCGRVD